MTLAYLLLQASVAVFAITGVIKGIGGGLIRDVVTGNPNILLRRELYMTPILLGDADLSQFALTRTRARCVHR